MKCKLGELQSSLIKTMIICGINNSTIREQQLQKDELTLDKAIEQCLIIEMSKARSDAIEGAATSGSSVNVINNRRRSRHSKMQGELRAEDRINKVARIPAAETTSRQRILGTVQNAEGHTR